jgi:lipopolysaccharide/colanic/teichoic acid biosynthesis glycosyltransferase
MENFPSFTIPGARERSAQKSDIVSLASLHHQKTGRAPVLPCPTDSDDVLAFDQELPSLDDMWSYQIAKRILDVLLAIALVPVLIPVLLALTVVVKLSSRGPVFFRQRRIGQNGRSFYLYKFRTMFSDSDLLLATHLAAMPEARREWEQYYKLRVDPRVTRLGALLRRTSLDELPQILNVLVGHMSLVGPRPVVEEELLRYGASLPFYTAAKPGITGLWQISGRGRLSYEARVSLDVHYVKTWSLLQDLRVLLKTAAAVWRCDGAY